MNKKDFQKTIKQIRGEMNQGNFPKAMMTWVQESQRTATINCGREYKGKKASLAIANDIMENEAFNAMLERNGAQAETESNSAGTQIRIAW